jgi:hypothetical protein
MRCVAKPDPGREIYSIARRVSLLHDNQGVFWRGASGQYRGVNIAAYDQSGVFAGVGAHPGIVSLAFYVSAPVAHLYISDSSVK